MTVAVVTPWYEHPELWPDYDAAIRHGRPDELIIVDNHSEPALEFSTHRAQSNLGFAGACNLGLELAESDVVVFLNNDISAGRDGWCDLFREHVQPGVLAGAQLRTDQHAWVDGTPMPYLDGWCIAGMRDDLLELGGFDTTLTEPAYYSDNLLCLEARGHGFTLIELNTGLKHKLNATARDFLNVQEATLANRERYWARARHLFGVTEPVPAASGEI